MDAVKVAAAALVVALVAVAAAAYAVASLNRAAQAQAEEAQRIASALEEVNRRLEELNAKVNALSAETLTRADYEELAAQVQALAEAIARLEASNQEALAQIEELRARLGEIADRLSRVETLILFPVEVVDGSGAKVVIPSRPERIVSLAPSVTETLYYVNATNRLVGVDSYSDWPEWVAEARENGTLVDVGGFWTPSVEAILSAQPDLVVGVAGVPAHESLRDVLAAHGIPLILLPQESLADIKESLIILGKATGNIVEAALAAADFEAAVARVKVAAPANAAVKAAILVWVNPAYVAGSGTFQDSLLSAVGAVNAFANVTGWAAVNPEEFLSAAPDVIIAVGIPVEAVYKYFNETLGEAAKEIPAIASGRVYCLGPPYSDMINRPSPRIVGVLTVVQSIIYPDLYGLGPDYPPPCVNATVLPEPPEPPLP